MAAERPVHPDLNPLTQETWGRFIVHAGSPGGWTDEEWLWNEIARLTAEIQVYRSGQVEHVYMQIGDVIDTLEALRSEIAPT